MYAPDLAGLHEHLLANGVKVPPIKYPEYMPSGMMEMTDPDAYRLGIHHLGNAEHDAREKRVAKKE